MADDRFDAIVVGAGPAGVSAAITMAKAGLNVALLERGEYAGAKNVQGAVLYSKMLADVVPEFWKNCPLERAIVDEKLMLLTETSGVIGGLKSVDLDTVPANSYTIIRVEFDKWFSKKAEDAGVSLLTGVTVSDVVRQDGKIGGIKTTEGDELFADVVIACDGVTSILAQKAGLHREWKPSEVALGVKEVLGLPRGVIEDRFALEKDQGATIEMFGAVTRGMLGYAFLYTNKESLALGVGVAVDELQRTNVRPYELLEAVKAHPLVRPFIRGAKTLEYSGHLIPEGGYHSMPPLYTDGFLLAGDAAQMINPAHREGSNLAMKSGQLAGETVIEAKKKNDFSSVSLASYKKRLEQSFVLTDLRDRSDLENNVRRRPGLLSVYPALLTRAAKEYFHVDGAPKREYMGRILRMFLKERGIANLMKDAWALRQMAIFK